MEKKYLVGFMPYKFQDDAGRIIEGYSLQFVCESDNYKGLKIEKFACNKDVFEPIEEEVLEFLLNDKYVPVTVYFNRFGKISNLLIAY